MAKRMTFNDKLGMAGEVMVHTRAVHKEHQVSEQFSLYYEISFEQDYVRVFISYSTDGFQRTENVYKVTHMFHIPELWLMNNGARIKEIQTQIKLEMFNLRQKAGE